MGSDALRGAHVRLTPSLGGRRLHESSRGLRRGKVRLPANGTGGGGSRGWLASSFRGGGHDERGDVVGGFSAGQATSVRTDRAADRGCPHTVAGWNVSKGLPSLDLGCNLGRAFIAGCGESSEPGSIAGRSKVSVS